MKPIPLRNLAAPSPSVLNFLRAQVKNAFESPTVQCAALKEQRRGYVRDSRVGGCLNGRGRGGNTERSEGVRLGSSGAFTPPKGCHLDSRTTRAGLAACCSSLAAADASYNPLLGIQPCRREFSTTSLSKAWQLFGGRKQRQPNRLQPLSQPLRDVMGDHSTGFDVLGRMARPANELKMRCTELDQEGNVTMISGEFKKSELIAKVRLAC